MAITYYMLQIPAWIFFVAIVSGCTLFAGFATHVFRKRIRLKILRSHNEVTGFLYFAISTFYALLLSFVILVVWEQLGETHRNASKEGSSAMSLYRDIKFYPDSVESEKLMVVYLDYVFNVVDDEFPKMELMRQSPKTTASFDKVFYTMERLNPISNMQIQLVSEMFNHFNEIATYRGLRLTSLKTEIPSPIWLPIIFGGLILIICAMFLDVEYMRLHVILNAFVGFLIGCFLFTIIILDHPYTGENKIEPKGYEQIFTLEESNEKTVSTDLIN